MNRGGNFGGDNFGRGEMTCDTVHLILCVSVSVQSSTSGVNNAVYLLQEGTEEAGVDTEEETDTTDLVGTVS